MTATITVPAAGIASALLRTLATQAKADVEALQAGTTITGVNGTTIAAGGALAVGQVLRATAAGAAGWGAVDLADTDAVTGTLPGANVQAASAGNAGSMSAADFSKLGLYPAIAALTTGQIPRATGAATVAFGALDLANASAVTGTLPGASVQAAGSTNQGVITAVQFLQLYYGDAGLCHGVRGIVTTNVANLSAFTVAGHDGLTFAEGDRVGLVNQTNGLEDGPYVVGVVDTGVAPLTRVGDWYGGTQRAGSSMRASEGTAWKHVEWIARAAGDIIVGMVAPDFYPQRQSGTTAAMATGVTVSNVWLKSTSQAVSSIIVGTNTAGGTMKHVAVPIASRTAGKGTGSFFIDGDVADTSTMDWTILQ